MIVPCIKCGKTLPVIDANNNHADDANEFHTYGQYGSRVFDPGNGDCLAINICDECIVLAGKEGRVLIRECDGAEYKPWGPMAPGVLPSEEEPKQ